MVPSCCHCCSLLASNETFPFSISSAEPGLMEPSVVMPTMLASADLVTPVTVDHRPFMHLKFDALIRSDTSKNAHHVDNVEISNIDPISMNLLV